MSLATLGNALAPQTSARLFACVRDHGSAAHPYHNSTELLQDPQSTRNLIDAVHFLCTIHGRYPGIVDNAAKRATEPVARAWFSAALEGFSVERAFLARLVVEVGPVPSTPGAASAEAALVSQRHALEMLSRSERKGCALGAAMALILDWGRVRFVLNVAANRFAVPIPGCRLSDDQAIRDLADTVGTEPLAERAILFGAQQIMFQHHGLWDLLEARQLAREAR